MRCLGVFLRIKNSIKVSTRPFAKPLLEHHVKLNFGHNFYVNILQNVIISIPFLSNNNCYYSIVKVYINQNGLNKQTLLYSLYYLKY